MKKNNPYLDKINNAIPRLFALYNTDAVSPTYGMGDRYRWAWKLIDFGNGTFQGAANGLARLLSLNLLPDGVTDNSVLRRIDTMFHGAEKLRDSNGSLSEAFPFESSFCVTSLVAYDLLNAIDLLSAQIDDTQRTRYLNIVRPMIHFIHQADESHALISNHLATASAALFKWSLLTGEKGEDRGNLFLKRVLMHQSAEGWFNEYEGADPGYQSLCTYYMADIHKMHSDLNLLEPLRKSIQFLWHFAYPDGSFGGCYGSRNTRFYYPAGVEALSEEIEEAAALAEFIRHSIANNTTVTMDAIDEPNLVPMFNAYCWAAALFNERDEVTGKSLPPLPFQSEAQWRRRFIEAGLLIDKGKEHYTVISTHKGGVCYHFTRENSTIDVGAVAQSGRGQYFSNQAFHPENTVDLKEATLTITAPFVAMNKSLPSTFQFIILRILNLTVMRNLSIGDLIKKFLVRMLITGKKIAPVSNKRTIRLGPDISIEDRWDGNAQGFKRKEVKRPFSAIHMASQGYWQKQDDME